MIACGIKNEYLCFRQHQKNEMAHYATDCWDCELLTTHGWIECVGIADRSCYDLTVHAEKTKARLVAYISYDQPRESEVLKAELNKQKVGPKFKEKAKDIFAYFSEADSSLLEHLQCQLEKSGKISINIGSSTFELDSDIIKFVKAKQKISGKNIVPGVIEPSFGIGRILHAILEQTYYTRLNDEKRGVFGLPPHLAPVKCSVLPLINNEKFQVFVPKIVALLTRANISSKVDENQSIGRRYARTDEIGIPFGITIDGETIASEHVTVRDRETMFQIRVPISELAELISQLIDGKLVFAELDQQKYPRVEKQDDDKE